MESPTPVPRYVHQKSKKRVLTGGSSSSVCKDVEVLEITPPVSCISKPKSSRHDVVLCHEVIDVDPDEDVADLLMLDEVDLHRKGKEAMPNISSGLGASSNDDSWNIDDFNYSLFEEDFDDDYTSLESHFDHMDIPPGIEAPFPWLPSCLKNKTKPPPSITSTKSSSQPQLNGISACPHLNSPVSPSQLMPTSQSKWTSTTQIDVGIQSPVRKLPLTWLEPSVSEKKSTTSSGSSFFSSQSSMGPLNFKRVEEPSLAFGKSKRRTHSSRTTFIGPPNQIFSGAAYRPIVSNSKDAGINLKLNLPPVAPAMESTIPQWPDLPVNMMMPFTGPLYMPAYYIPSQPFTSEQKCASPVATSVPTTVVQRNVDDVQRNFRVFKKFDVVEDSSDHHYFKNASSVNLPPKNWAKKIHEEWKILEKDLPDAIFVRVYETRMDLLRAVIVGAEGTPYHDGLFFFDIFFPSNYPNVPPLVYYHSGGLRINPNLYNCGKVCLSLLNTWSGSHKEKWIPGVSTMLQVLVSIQGLILNAKPYFNEPGYANLSGSVNGEKLSVEYNENTFLHSLQTMLYSMRRPPKHFEDFVIGHYCMYGRDILVSCKAYMDGAQVGCLARGGVQDVDEGDKSCSQHFKNSLAGFIPVLVHTFLKIGTKNCEEFLHLTQKSDERATST